MARFAWLTCAIVASTFVGAAAPALADSGSLAPADGGFNPGVVTAQWIDLPAERVRAGAWVTAMDYPTAALMNERSGTVVVELTVGSDGRASDCKVIKSSKFAPLDAQTCNVFVKRARYVPARDASGNPVQGTTIESLRWKIPPG